MFIKPPLLELHGTAENWKDKYITSNMVITKNKNKLVSLSVSQSRYYNNDH